MNTIEIPDRKIVKKYPSCWDEMTDEQFDFVMQQVLKLMDGKIDMDVFRVLVLYHFLEMDYTPMIRKMERFRKKDNLHTRNYNVWRLTQTMNWFFVEKEIEGEMRQVFDFDSVRNFIPSLTVLGDTFYGPEDALMNISLAEFRIAGEYFRKYVKDKNENDLNLLIAALYRPERNNYQKIKNDENFNGQRRVSYNANHTERYAGTLGKASFYQRYAIYLWFANCNTFLREGEIEIEGNTINFGDLYKKETKDNETKESLGWTGLLFKLADEGTFGNINETDKECIYDIMLKLYQWKLDADAIKRQQDDTSTNL